MKATDICVIEVGMFACSHICELPGVPELRFGLVGGSEYPPPADIEIPFYDADRGFRAQDTTPLKPATLFDLTDSARICVVITGFMDKFATQTTEAILQRLSEAKKTTILGCVMPYRFVTNRPEVEDHYRRLVQRTEHGFVVDLDLIAAESGNELTLAKACALGADRARRYLHHLVRTAGRSSSSAELLNNLV